jgi:hypothetical protein
MKAEHRDVETCMTPTGDIGGFVSCLFPGFYSTVLFTQKNLESAADNSITVSEGKKIVLSTPFLLMISQLTISKEGFIDFSLQAPDNDDSNLAVGASSNRGMADA